MHVLAILLTKYFHNGADFHEWCQHHFSIGIDHVHVFDNESGFDLLSECNKYGDRISYEKVVNPRQYQLYTNFIKGCDADYVMPIDDDEYLWVSAKLHNIKTAITYYMEKLGQLDVFGIRWLYRFPKKFHTERIGSVMDYCTQENDYLATRFYGYGDRTIKCLVKKESFVRYMDADESRLRNHIPLSTGIDGALMCDGRITKQQYVFGNLEDEQIRLIHCPYKGYSEYLAKQEHNVAVCYNEPRPYQYGAFNMILDRIP